MFRVRFTGLFLMLFFFCSFQLKAQKQFGFEWIHPYQTYFKFKIVSEGVYYLDSVTLANSGINLNNLNPKRFQIIRNGQEIPLFIHGQNDSVLNANDYIEFYAKQNDGTLDSFLYQQTKFQPHTWRSMFTDTAVYFLTILPDTTKIISKRFLWQADTTFSNYTAEPYFLSEQKVTPAQHYLLGPVLAYFGNNPPEPFHSSEYLNGEGWASDNVDINGTQSIGFSISTPYKYTGSAPNPTFSSKIISDNNASPGASGFNHHVQLNVGPDNSNFSLIRDFKFTGLEVQTVDTVLSLSKIGNIQTVIHLDVINDLGIAADQDALSYIRLIYPRQYNLGNQPGILFNNLMLQNNSKTFIDFQNYSNGADTSPVFFDLTSNERVRGSFVSNHALGLLTYDVKPHAIYLADSLQFTPITSLTPVQFPVIDPTSNYDFLMVTHPSLSTSALAYKNFRSQRFKNVLLVYTQQLYDYYTCGNYSPIAVRRFADHLLSKSTVKPKFLLLAGRGYQTNLIRYNSTYYNKNLVPSLGVPSSDVKFTCGLTGSNFEADIPTGRVAAETDEELNNYLQKLITYESSDSIQEWRKFFLHLTGGSNLSEQQNLRSATDGAAAIVRGKSFGANITSFYKFNSSAQAVDFTAKCIQLQNSGISMVTFYGHGSMTYADIDFGGINDLNNQNKYPFYYLNGCNIGNANDVDPGSSGKFYGKTFICTANKGAIGWLANTNLSSTGNLSLQITNFYQQLGITNYGMPIGYIIQQTSAGFSGSDEITRMHNLQWLLQGDPAAIIYSPALPDYKISSSDIFITPSNATALSDSFAVAAIITNQARATDDSIDVTLERTFPNNTKLIPVTIRYKPVYYKDTVYIWVRSNDPSARGNNTFCISLDKQNRITESNESNNSSCYNFFLPGTGITNLFPYDCSIVNGDTAILVIQNNDYFVQSAQYIIEIDTSIQFNPASSFFKSSGVLNATSIASWKTVLPHTDTLVYFWRSRLNIPVIQGGTWTQSSFTYIQNGENGWAQSNLDQYKNVSVDNGIVFDSNSRSMQFVPFQQSVSTRIRRWTHANMGNFNPYTMNPSTGTCVTDGIVVNIFDGKTLQPFENPRYPFNCSWVISWNASHTTEKYFYYTFNTTSQPGRDDFRRFIDSLDNGTYIAIYARYDADVPNWDPLTKQYLNKIGSQKVATIPGPYYTFAIIGQKGLAISKAVEDTLFNNKYIGQNVPFNGDSLASDIIDITYPMISKLNAGDFRSKKIGPASKWGKLFYYFNSIENNGRDYQHVDLYAVKNDGTDSLLILNVSTATDLSFLNTTKIRFIKLAASFSDSFNLTPNQFGRWIVTFQGTAEGTIDPNFSYSFYNDNLQQGDSLKMKIGFTNLTKFPFDSLPVEIKITDPNRNIPLDSFYMYSPLAAFSSVSINKNFSTRKLSGNNSFQLIVNGNMRTPELNIANNIFTKNFNVMVDKANPLMEVTFDGYRIMNGDYVSPTPVIRVISKDNNPFILQNDTSTFALYIKRPASNTFEYINMSSNRIHFTPGTSQNNKAILEYTPEPLPDGIYSLQVISKDASGNLSGTNMYSIDFNVVNESMITNFFPYPNPCTTNMRFVFTLTGSKPPDDLLIRILTITGKIVKEVTKSEFGNIHIGNNISEWAWDGNDTYGDRLANGVYLYQVLTRIDKEEIKKLDTKADKYFIRNTGKIYLMH